MKKSELKNLIKLIIKENRYAAEHPENIDFPANNIWQVWGNIHEVEKLKKQLMNSIDAGNFDEAQRILKTLEGYHN
jgi:hypothetical protein